jgi:hypothetical protein
LEGGQQRERITARGRLCYHIGAQPVGQWHLRRRGEGQGLSLQEPIQLLGERSITQRAKESLQRESESHLCSLLGAVHLVDGVHGIITQVAQFIAVYNGIKA